MAEEKSAMVGAEPSNGSQKLLQEFLRNFEDPQKLTLENYTGNGDNREDFTYWVEWNLDCFGGIKGGSSYKFGIYKYKEEPEKREGYNLDSNKRYAWATKYDKNNSANYEEVFEVIRGEIEKVVKAVNGDSVDYDAIEKVELGEAYKWKIAFLYSSYKLVPVYQRDALFQAAKRLNVLPDNNNNNNNKVTVAALQKALFDYYSKNESDFDNDICKFGGYVWNIGTADLSQSNQIIKYGAPGTGKTYSVKREAEEFFNIWKLDAQNSSEEFEKHYEFVQFHPSYSYEDFIEGIKPVLKNGKTELQLQDGIFKKVCRKAAAYEIWLLKKGLIQPDKKNGRQLNEVTVADVKTNQDKDCPFNFPQGINDNDHILQYIPPYFFVIDEINRADLSRVFGELMYCLEYRGYEGRIKTQYSELESVYTNTIFYEDNNQHYFFIPENVYIIGTMNTIDRSIESFDFALRRRFLWQRVNPNENVLQEYFEREKAEDTGKNLIRYWKKLNEAIANNQLLGEDYEIGHSYLMKLDKYPDCKTPSAYHDIIWQKHILPILEEYFRGLGGEAKEPIEKLKKEFFPKTGSKAQKTNIKQTENPNNSKEIGKDEDA